MINHTQLPRDYPFLNHAYDFNNPNPWQTLYLDNSVPIHDGVKKAWLYDSQTWSRQFILPFVRPIARIMIVLIQILRSIVPNKFTSSKYLHQFLTWGLKNFATPEANWLILRHFWVGTENLCFLNDNIQGAGVTMRPLRPKKLDDLKDDLFLKHDINLFNFIARLQLNLRKENINVVTPKDTLSFDSITSDGDFEIDEMPNGFFNVLDLQTCIDLFTPIFQSFLSDGDFWRSVHSLQLDETIAIYAAKVIKFPEGLILVNNKHPLVLPATWNAGYRLVLHGLSSEMLHAIFVQLKNKNTQNTHSVK